MVTISIGLSTTLAMGTLAMTAGSAGASEAPDKVLQHAAEKALAQKSAQCSMSVSIGVAGTSLTVIKTVGNETFTTPIQASFTSTVATGTTGKTTTLPEELDGTTLYLQVSGVWYYMTSQQILAQEGVSGSLANSGNPTEALAFLYQSGAKVTDLGHHRLDGQTMSEYSLSVSPGKGFTPPDGMSFTPQGLAAYKKLTGGKPLSLHVWVDRSGVLRQEQVHIPLSSSGLSSMGLTGAPAGTAMTMTIAMSDFGVPVHVTVPATAQPLPTSGAAQS